MRRLNLAATLALALAACAAPTPAPTRRAVRAAVEPSLTAIFAENSLDGRRPSDIAVSCDGKFVSYRLTAARPESAASAPSAASPTRLYVVSTAGGKAVDLGEIPPAIWYGSNSKLLWCAGKDVKSWTAGDPIDKARTVVTFDKPVSAPRMATVPWFLTVQSDDRTWVLDEDTFLAEGAAVKPTKLDYPEGFVLERWIHSEWPPVALLRKRAERPASIPASAPSSLPESAPTSLPASVPESMASSAPQSRPDTVRYGVQTWAMDGKPGGFWEFETPRTRELDSATLARNYESALVVLREGDRTRRTGMVPDYLTGRVTTRPARGASAADVEPRRSLWLARSGQDSLVPLTPFSEPRRARFESLAPVVVGPTFMTTVTEEDRKGRTVHAITVDAVPNSTANVVKLLETPGPVGGVESSTVENGQAFFVSEGSGRARAYVTDGTGGLRAFTPEGVDVHWIRFANPNLSPQLAPGVGIALVCDPSRPYEREFWRVSSNGGAPAKLPMQGMFASSPVLSRDGSTVAFLGSTLGSVEDLYTMPTDGSSGPRRLTFTAPDPAKVPGGEVPLRIVEYTGLDGTPLWAMVYEPPESVQRNGAAVIFLHGAGYLQQVRASTGNPNYAVNHHFHRRLAQLGYVVLAPDFRGSAGYGRKFRTDVYQNLGIPDSDDIVASKRWLVANCGVDMRRVGLYGGSYGGFLTLMCMFRYPLEFGAGAALRSVTDWRAYQPDYTRPLLGGGPSEVPDVYKRCSPIDHADQLARPLLLLHGMMDDNVFAQDTLRLVEALQKAGKTDLFELMLYPSQNHAFTSPHAWVDEYQRIESFFDEHLVENPHE